MKFELNCMHLRICTKVAGHITIEGKAISASAFINMLDWCKRLSEEQVFLTIKLDHLSMGAFRLLIDVLKTLQANRNIFKIIVRWHIHSDDDDMIEKGNLLNELFPPVKFIFKINNKEIHSNSQNKNPERK